MSAIYAVMVLSCIATMITLCVHVRHNKVLKDQAVKWFILCYAMVAVGIGAEGLGVHLSDLHRFPVLLRGIKCVEFCLNPWIAFCIAKACDVGKPARITGLIAAVHTAVEIVMLPFGRIVNVQDGSYVRGDLYHLYISFYILSFISIIHVFLIFHERYRDHLTLYMISLVMVIPVLASILIHGARTAFLGMTLVGVLLYLYYEDVSQRELQTALEKQQRELENTLVELEARQEELKSARNAAEAAARAKTEFLFNMSHDIRTPMNAVIGFANLLETYRFDDEKFERYLKNIQISSEHLLNLINSVLEMSRIESGKVDLVDTDICDIEELSDNISSIFMSDLRKKKQTLSRSVKVEHSTIYCDRTKILQIFMNILSNSIKYTPEGGHIDLITEEVPCDRDGFAAYRIIVRDNGIGMSKEFLPHIFENFERERTSTESKVIGTGLGMGIVKRLVDLMQGTIHIDSELGQGTEVSIVIPVRIADDIDARRKALEAYEGEMDPESFRGRRILLAEDNDLNAEIAMEVLSEFGLIMERAENGAVAVQMMEAHEADYYDMILMDIQMPEMNGYEATRAIRGLEDPKKRSIPIAAMTANVFESDKKDAADSGMNDFLNKPIELDELTRAFRRWLR